MLLAVTNNVAAYLVGIGASGLAAGTFPCVLAMVTDLMHDTPPGHRAAVFGLTQGAVGLSFTIGPALGAVISTSYGQRTLFWVAAAVGVVDVVYIAFCVSETFDTTKQTSARAFWASVDPFRAMRVLVSSKRMVQLSIITALHGLALWCKISTLLLYLRSRFNAKEEQLGKFMSTLGACFLFSEALLTPFLAPRSIHNIAYTFEPVSQDWGVANDNGRSAGIRAAAHPNWVRREF